MYSLAVEISSKQGSLALFKKEDSNFVFIAESVWFKTKSHSEVITTELDQLLKSHHVKYTDLVSLCIGNGPGSFTGIRVGVNLVKSLSYSLNIPIYQMDSLRALAEPELDNSSVICIVNAIKNCFYISIYNKSKEGVIILQDPESVKLEQIQNYLVDLNTEPYKLCGDASSINTELKDLVLQINNTSLSEQEYPLARFVGRYCLDPKNQSSPMSWKELVPLYIRGSQAEEKLKEGLLKPVLRF